MQRSTHACGGVLCLMLIALGAMGCRGTCIDYPGGGPCMADDPSSGSIDDPYLVPTAATSVVAGIGLAVEIVTTADDSVVLPDGVHVGLALWGAGNVALGTASAIYSRDGGNYLIGPILAGVTGLPLIAMSIYNLVADPPKRSTGFLVSCTAGNCRAGVPHPKMMSDLRGAPSPGLQLVEARF